MSLSQLKVVELDKYIAHHNLGKYGTKKAKLEAIKENIIQELAKRIEREEDGKSDNQSTSDSLRSESEDDSEEEDCVLVFQALKRKRSFISLVICFTAKIAQTRNQIKTAAFAVIKRHLQKRGFADEPLSANETFLAP